jgi:hypothetical protein
MGKDVAKCLVITQNVCCSLLYCTRPLMPISFNRLRGVVVKIDTSPADKVGVGALVLLFHSDFSYLIFCTI